MSFLTISLIVFAVGIIVLYFGAEGLVRGSSLLAKNLGIRPIIIGLTVVAFGTSSPEFVVSFVASLHKSQDIALGNIIGSNIANIGLILGVSALIHPLKVHLYTLKKEFPVMILASVVIYLMAFDFKIGFWDGTLLTLGIILFILYQVLVSLRDRSEHKSLEKEYTSILRNGSTYFKNIALVAIGITGLIVGSQMMVKSVITIARELGVSELVIGMTLMAFGTSLPELATSVISAIRKEADICVGNVIGSNLFNILFVVGIITMFNPLTVTKSTLKLEFPIMLAFTFLLFPILKTKLILNRFEGAVLVAGYVLFVSILIF
ncbi:calcium/sodium antiporter [candidate division KSB1 bacterium]|nr:calcium/sodium antiporter [candidate division KSB1 bacterium]